MYDNCISYNLDGTWNRFYTLRRKDENNELINENEINELRRLQTKFEEYLQLLRLFEKKIDTLSINPKIFGVRLTGGLIKMITATTFSIVVAIVKFVCF